MFWNQRMSDPFVSERLHLDVVKKRCNPVLCLRNVLCHLCTAHRCLNYQHNNRGLCKGVVLTSASRRSLKNFHASSNLRSIHVTAGLVNNFLLDVSMKWTWLIVKTVRNISTFIMFCWFWGYVSSTNCWASLIDPNAEIIKRFRVPQPSEAIHIQNYIINNYEKSDQAVTHGTCKEKVKTGWYQMNFALTRNLRSEHVRLMSCRCVCLFSEKSSGSCLA